MEKVLHPYDKERMRLEMLKHEETFREQVHELHRLYRIQKMLMGSGGLGPQQQQQKQDRFLIETKKPFEITHQSHHHHHHHQQQQQQQQEAQQINGDVKPSNIMVMGLVDMPDGQAAGMIRSSGQERVPESNGNMMSDENEIELTLSLGPSAHNPRRRRPDGSESGQSISSSSTGSSQTRKTSPNKRRGENQFTWGSSSFPQGSETQPGFSNGQQTNPPWLYHALSLKLT